MGYVDRVVRVERRQYALEDRFKETRKEFLLVKDQLALCQGALADLNMALKFLFPDETAAPGAPNAGTTDGDDYDGIPDEPASEFLDWGDDDPVPEVWGDES